jgi:hypothetical protein
MTMWPTAIVSLLGNLLDRVLPDPKIASDAKLEMLKMAQSGELAQLNADLQLAQGQMDINKVEAANSSLFVSGWRPAIGWICGAAFGFKFIGGPAAFVISQWVGHPITLPNFDFTEMSTILMGMLGLAGMRSVEKIKGAA